LTREQLIDAIVPGLLKNNPTFVSPIRARSAAEYWDLETLHRIYDQHVSAGLIKPQQPREPIFKKPQSDAAAVAEQFRERERQRHQRIQDEIQHRFQERFQESTALNQIFSTVINNRVLSRNTANERILLSLVDEARGEVLSVDWFKNVIQEPGIASQLVWEVYQTPEQHQAATTQAEEEDRKTFALACRSYSRADNEANYRMVLESVGSGFSLFDIEQAIRNGLQLVPASQEQAGIWAEEAAKQRQIWLKTQATPADLRAAAAVEAETNRVAQKQAEDARALQAAKESGYPPLPTHFQGQVLDKRFLWLASKELTKYLFSKYGQRQLESRVRGLS
jgi:hypothetical protein